MKSKCLKYAQIPAHPRMPGKKKPDRAAGFLPYSDNCKSLYQCLDYFVHAVIKSFDDIVDDLGDLLLNFLRSIWKCVGDIGCKE